MAGYRHTDCGQEDNALKEQKREKWISWFRIFKQGFTNAEVTSSSVMVAYYLLLSIFPLTIAIGNILPYLNISPQTVLPYIDAMLPPDIQMVLDPIIINLLTRSSGGLLSISAIGLLWSASRGVNYLQKAMNKAYGIPTQGLAFLKRLFSMVMVMGIILLLVLFMLVYGLGQTLITYLADNYEWAYNVDRYLSNFKWPVTLAVLVCMLMLVYRVIPDTKLRMRHIWPGALFATAGIGLMTQLFTIYLRFTAQSFSSYGTLGAFFLLMFWLNFSCAILILGAVLNASLQEIREGKPLPHRSRLDNYLQTKMEELLQKWREKKETKARAKQAAEEREESTKAKKEEK